MSTRRRPAVSGGLIAAGVALLAVGMVGGERFEYLGAWVHILQHLLLMAGGPVLLVEGLIASGRSFPGRSVPRRSGRRSRSGVGRGSVLAAVGYYGIQPLLLLTPWFGALELHAGLHLATHLLLIGLGLAYWGAVLGGRLGEATGAGTADAAGVRRQQILVLAAIPVGLALAAALAFGPAIGSVTELRSAAWLVALAAAVPAVFALLRISRPTPVLAVSHSESGVNYPVSG